MDTTRQQVYQDALDKWGLDAQWGMVHEECLELAMAIHKFRRTQDMDSIIDEVADVKIMMEQVELYVDMDKVNERMDFKIERLKGKLHKRTET